MKNFIAARKKNFETLRQISNQAGAQFERMSYEELMALSEESFKWPKTQIAGYEVVFSGEARLTKEGDVEYTLDMWSDMPTFLGIRPSYHFYKKKDGTVYY